LGLRVESAIPTPSSVMNYLDHLGVIPRLWEQGMGWELVQHLLQAAALLPNSTVMLDMATTADKAQPLHQRLGFEAVREQ
jgi:predicted N-acetyltransferase YhbS